MRNKVKILNWRFFLICACISFSILAVIYKVFSIQIKESNFLQNEGNKRYVKYKNISPVRGSIFDKNNFPLAVTLVNYDLYALRGFKKTNLLKVAENIEIEFNDVDQVFVKKTLLKKNISKQEINKLKKLNIKNFEIETRHSRHYPLGEQIAPLIGFYGTDGAQEGLEKSYDSILSGVPGKKKYFKNAKQEIFSQPIEIEKAVQGKDIHLTIDATLQFFAYKYLVEGIRNNKAKAGSVVILDNKKGDVLAMASYPSYNPNNPERKIQKNRVLVDAYELGSVLKPIMISKAIDLEIFNPEEYIEIPRRLNLDDKIIVDTKNHEKLTPKEIISVSSQIGASKIAIAIGYDELKQNYYDFGFTKPVSLNFPSTAFGYMNIKEKVADKELASLGYGYGITVSPFQIASAYSVFANKGFRKDFKIIQSEETTLEKIITEESSIHILDALKKVVKEGTGKAAEVRGFSEGGKTGTVHQIVRGSGYAEDLYRASFVGIAPLSEESLTIFVSIDDPGLNAYSGGSVAAPIFAKIAENSLNYMGYFEDE